MEEKYHKERSLDPDENNAKLKLVLKIMKQVQDSLGNAISLMETGDTAGAEEVIQRLTTEKQMIDADVATETGTRIVEGVFDGINMVGSDGKVYNVPPNYASKSRLVEGDIMKLTIKSDGTFVYKQIGPIDRKRVVGKLAQDQETGEYVVMGDGGESWKVIRASITYYHGTPGDEVVMLVPKNTPSTWAAVENVVKK